MPSYKSVYKRKWEEEVDGTGRKIGLWCKKKTDTHAECKICNMDFCISHTGKSAIIKHAKS